MRRDSEESGRNGSNADLASYYGSKSYDDLEPSKSIVGSKSYDTDLKSYGGLGSKSFDLDSKKYNLSSNSFDLDSTEPPRRPFRYSQIFMLYFETQCGKVPKYWFPLIFAVLRSF